jgi:hypothetical protein
MPWTFAHPAAVLPFARLTGPRALSPLALAVGALGPDLPYYVPGNELAWTAHKAHGVVLIALPAALLVYTLVRWLRRPVVALLPQPHRAFAQNACDATPPLTGFSLAMIALSALIGAVTHVVWDAFTHAGRFFVVLIPVLQTPLFNTDSYTVRVFHLLQHLSTLVGGAALLAFYLRRLARFQAVHAIAREPGDLRRYVTLALLVIGGFLLTAPLAYLHSREAGVMQGEFYTFLQAVYGADAVFLGLVALALARAPRTS